MKEIINSILNLAINAPSGHNSQPWKFVFKNNSLFIYNLPQKDTTLFNHKQKGSLVAHGALIENIIIAASEKGFKTNIFLFPEKYDSNLISKLDFEKTQEKYQYENFWPFILKRTTNRKPFKKMPILPQNEKKINDFVRSLDANKNRILFLNDRKKISEAAALFSLGDRLLFENFYLHKGLFDNINWTLKEEQEKREGLYVKTKELSLFQELVLKYVFGNWNLLNKLNKIKLCNIIAKKREKLYQNCSLIGLITASYDKPENFVETGRVVERFWLLLTSLNISFQPMSVGLLYLGQWTEAENPTSLTLKQINDVKESYQKIKNLFQLKNQVPIFSFRIGYSDSPTASSLKKSPVITFEE